MLVGKTFYHGIIRKTIVAFGSLFSNIKIERQLKDGTNAIAQTINVPIAYAPKEKWLVRLEQDPTLEQQVYTTLPRISFEVLGISYDGNRKLNRMNQVVCYTAGTAASGSTPATPDSYKRMYAPVPYNIDIALYVLTKTQEDAMQIVEQILPYFTPEFTLSIKAVPDMNVITDIPIILNSVSSQDDYDGDFQTRRFVTYTLNFQLKVNLFGPVEGGAPIKKVFAQVAGDAPALYTVEQNTPIATITEDWLEDNF
jgi:hypothetical protein